jgi:hypothetical protein
MAPFSQIGGRSTVANLRVFAASRVALLVILVSGLGAARAEAQYTVPSGHPRIFFNNSTIGAIADRCKVGGTHRQFYQALITFSDGSINNGNYGSDRIPNYALVYKIHRQWNQTGYNGGGFEENKYWQAARNGVLASGNWSQNEGGAQTALAADWIWEKLTPSEITSIASYYGTPASSVGDGDTWRMGKLLSVATHVMRSALFAGSGVADAAYNAEYQSAMAYLQNTYAPAFGLSGAGMLGPHYENDGQYLRGFVFETMRTTTGVDPWPLCQKWASEHGKWNIYGKTPLINEVVLQEDAEAFVYGTETPLTTTVMALRSQDAFAQRITVDNWTASQGWQPTDYRKRWLWCLVLWYDNNLPPADLASSPLSVRIGAGGVENVYMRSSWTDPSYTLATFQCGKYFYGHMHQDVGAFQIIRKGFLALDSGGYYQYQAQNGDDYAQNYYRRSVAHNVMHVYDKDETFWAAWNSNLQLANDGGQHVAPSNPTYQDLLNLPEFSTGQMLRYESSSSYTYSQANCAPAYNSARIAQRYGKPPYTNKITNYTREFVYLRPNFFVVIDRISTKNANLSKVWNLHVAGNPQVTGTGVQLAGGATAGIWKYDGAEIAKVTDGTPQFSGGSLFVKSLMPKQRTMRKIGGENRSSSGYAYWVGGITAANKYDPTLGENHYWGAWTGSGREENMWATPIGWGRIEVEPTVPAVTDVFLHVLYPADQSVSQMPATKLLESPNAVGAEIVNDRVILFGRTETAALDSVTYTVDIATLSATHMIADLTPGSTYRVYRNASTFYVRRQGLPAPAGATELVTPPPVATPGGIIEFTSAGGSSQIVVSNVAWTKAPNPPLSITITWTTNVASDSQVEYGTTPSYGLLSPLLAPLVTSHSVTLAEPAIQNDVLYNFRVISRAPGGLVGFSGNGQFQGDVVSPGRITDNRAR